MSSTNNNTPTGYLTFHRLPGRTLIIHVLRMPPASLRVLYRPTICESSRTGFGWRRGESSGSPRPKQRERVSLRGERGGCYSPEGERVVTHEEREKVLVLVLRFY